jgi:hypothetical protein
MPHLALLLLAASAVGHAQAGTSQAAPQTPAKPGRVHTQLDGFDLSSQKKTATANQIGGASRGIGKPTLYAPGVGKSYSTHPLFQWSLGGPGVKVHFVLKDANNSVVYETTLESNSLAYPGDAPGLSPGSTYTWTVKPELDMMGSQPAPVEIMILGGADREKIAGQLASATPEQAAKIFVDNRIWYDAIGTYTNQISQHPDARDLHRQRGTVYDQLPQTQALAEKDFAAAGPS